MSLETLSSCSFSFLEKKKKRKLAEKQTVKARSIMMVDAGLEFNSPYPAVLGHHRSADVLLSFDFSARDHDDSFPFKVRSASNLNTIALICWALENYIAAARESTDYCPVAVEEGCLRRKATLAAYEHRVDLGLSVMLSIHYAQAIPRHGTLRFNAVPVFCLHVCLAVLVLGNPAGREMGKEKRHSFPADQRWGAVWEVRMEGVLRVQRPQGPGLPYRPALCSFEQDLQGLQGTRYRCNEHYPTSLLWIALNICCFRWLDQSRICWIVLFGFYFASWMCVAGFLRSKRLRDTNGKGTVVKMSRATRHPHAPRTCQAPVIESIRTVGWSVPILPWVGRSVLELVTFPENLNKLIHPLPHQSPKISMTNVIYFADTYIVAFEIILVSSWRAQLSSFWY